MTRNQIAYQELLEKQRSNLANEAENARANRARELYQAQSNEIANKQIALGYANAQNAKEIAQINAGAAYYAANKNYEARQNELAFSYEKLNSDSAQAARNWLLNQNELGYKYQVLSETTRSNQARESETQRHNIATEKYTSVNNQLNALGTLTRATTSVLLLNP